MRDNSPWIELHSGVREHHKLSELSSLLKIEYAHAVGLMACLWSSPYIMSHNGNLTNCSDVFIAKLALWTGDCQAFVNALKKVKLFDGKFIHDYDLHGHRMLLKNRRRVKRYRNSKRNVTVSATEPTEPTEPNKQTNRTLSNGFFNEKDEKIIKREIAKRRGWNQDSEAVRIRLQEIISEIAGAKDVKNKVAVAITKARIQ